MAYLSGAGNTDQITTATGITKAGTFSLFVRVTPTAANSTLRFLAGIRDATTGVNAQIYFNTAATNQVSLLFSTAGFTGFPAVSWTSGFTAGTVHTLVGTYDGTDLKLYADTDATPKVSAAFTDVPDQTAGEIVWIGGDGATGSSASTLYEVGWWPGTVLTGSEAAGMGAGTPPGTLPSNYWPLVSTAVALYGGLDGTVSGASVVAHSGTNLYAAAAAPTRRALSLLGVS